MDAPAAEPLRAEWAADVLTIRIDTPGCDVNIFSHRAAVQLVEILDGVDPDAVRAIVLRSDKPGSFVNGVGLMLANAVQAPEDVARLTEPVRRAYQKLADAPVPTIAALQGNCFGCGVELSLMCDYRVAQRSWDTQLYMTEIADYLFVPCFGGTQNLPQLLGLRAATELLLWGHRCGPPRHTRGGSSMRSSSPLVSTRACVPSWTGFWRGSVPRAPGMRGTGRRTRLSPRSRAGTSTPWRSATAPCTSNASS
jgi:enoyl-CoA hydratase/carnithine racemase